MRVPVRSRPPVVVTVHDVALLRMPEAFPAWHRRTGRIALAARCTRRGRDRHGVGLHPRRARRAGRRPGGQGSSRAERDRARLLTRGAAGRGRLRPLRRNARATQEPRQGRRGGTAAGVELRVVGAPGWGGVDGPAAGSAASTTTSSRRCIRGARCLVFPSLYEGFGIPDRGGDGLRHAGRDEPGRRDGGGRGRRGGSGRSARCSTRSRQGSSTPTVVVTSSSGSGSSGHAASRGIALPPQLVESVAGAGVSDPLVVVDADVLGRRRTGRRDLRAESAARAPGPCGRQRRSHRRRHAANRISSRRACEPIELAARSQELRMAWSLPRLLHRLGASLVHTQYALPLRCPCPAVVTIHDLSFERDASLMSAGRRAAFRWAVPRAARGAARVLTVSERSKRDIVELYDVPPERIVVTPNGVDPVFRPGAPGGRDYVLAVGAIQRRKNQLAALLAAREVGLPLVVVGPEKEPAVARRLREQGATLRGYVSIDELAALYRGAACLVQASRYEGFGLPVLEAMASGTPVVTVPDAALLEVVADAAVVVEEHELADGIRRALVDREALSRARPGAGAGLLLARGRRADARRLPGGARPVTISAVVVSHGHAAELERSLPALLPQVDQVVSSRTLPGSVGVVPAGRSGDREREAAAACGERQPRHRGDGGRPCPLLESRRGRRAGSGRRPRRDHGRARPAAASPALRCSGPTARGSRRGGASRRCRGRSCDARRSARSIRPYERQSEHYLLDERPTEPVAGRLDARRLPAPAPDDARGDRRLGRRLPALRRGHRPLLPGDARRLGAVVRARPQSSATPTPP